MERKVTTATVTMNLTFTDRALARIRAKHGPVEFQLRLQVSGIYPQRGDLVEVAGVDIKFSVLGRVFKYDRDGNITLTYVLDLPHSDEREPFRVVGKDDAPAE